MALGLGHITNPVDGRLQYWSEQVDTEFGIAIVPDGSRPPACMGVNTETANVQCCSDTAIIAEDGDDPQQTYLQATGPRRATCLAAGIELPYAESVIVNFPATNADPNDDDGCLSDRTRPFGAAACAADGARLCTAEEISNRCTMNTGCGINDDRVWSALPCDSPNMVMPRKFRWSAPTNQECKSNEDWAWYDRSCSLKIQVDDDAMVTIVHTPDDGLPENNNNGYIYKAARLDSQNKFFVSWDGNSKPSSASSCGGSSDCEVIETDVERSCLCNVTIIDTAVFVDASDVPSAQDVMAQLHVGAALPDTFDAGTYSRCTTTPCLASDVDEIWTTAGDEFDANTIFKVIDDKGRELTFANTLSTVQFDGFSFRNPPHMVKTHQTYLLR